MDDLLDFYIMITIFAVYALPFLLIGWALESWWMSLPAYKRRAILRKMGVK